MGSHRDKAPMAFGWNLFRARRQLGPGAIAYRVTRQLSGRLMRCCMGDTTVLTESLTLTAIEPKPLETIMRESMRKRCGRQCVKSSHSAVQCSVASRHGTRHQRSYSHHMCIVQHETLTKV